MITMKIVVNRHRNTRTVINTDFEEPLMVFDSHSQNRSYYTAADSASRERDNSFQHNWRRPRNTFFERKRIERKERNARYHAKKRVRRDLAITREQFAQLSVSFSTNDQKDERIENSSEPSCAIQLKKPVLQFSRSYEEPSSSNACAASSTSTEKADPSSESLTKIFECRMCPNYSVPEVHECSEGHLVCPECCLISSHCTLCSNESFDDESTKRCSDFRRVHCMEKIASLLTFPCRWRERGCLEYLGPGDWRDHVDSCRHAEVLVNPLASASQVSSSDLSDYEIDVEEKCR